MPAVPKFHVRALATALCALALLFQQPSAGSSENAHSAALTILHTNDIHGHLFPFDYDRLGKVEMDVGGAARRVTLIRQLRAKAGHAVLVLDAGDVFTRGPIADLKGVPDFDVMNQVPYDAITLGNNEFKGASGIEGQIIMFDRIRQARFAVVSANVFDKATDKTIVPPYKIFDRDGLRIGVFGLTAPRVATYEQAKGLDIRNPIDIARTIIPQLRKQCDFVVALTHIGYIMDLELAASVPGIDVIIGGDSHTWLFQPTLVGSGKNGSSASWIGGTIVCQDGEWGKCVGKLDLSLQQVGDHSYKVTKYSGKLAEVDSSVQPAKDIESTLDRYAKPYMTKVGYLKTTVPEAKAAVWLAERMREAAGTQVGMETRDAVENGLKAGVVTELDIRKMLPFANRVVKLKVTGKQLWALASQDDVALAGAAMVNGVLRVGQSKVEDDATYTLATEDYASALSALAGAQREELGMTTRDVVQRYVTSGSAKK